MTIVYKYTATPKFSVVLRHCPRRTCDGREELRQAAVKRLDGVAQD